MEMLIPIVLCVAAFIAVIESVAEKECENDSDDCEGTRTHTDMVWPQLGGCEDESWVISSAADAATAWGTGLEEDLFSTSCLDGNSEWRDAANDRRHVVNPANGLPMTSGSESGVDVMGNPYGTDFHRDQADYFGCSGSGGVDSWSGGSSGQVGSFGGCDDWS